jgi:hypothetical protein
LIVGDKRCQRAETIREEELWRKNNRGRRITDGGSIRELGHALRLVRWKIEARKTQKHFVCAK